MTSVSPIALSVLTIVKVVYWDHVHNHAEVTLQAQNVFNRLLDLGICFPEPHLEHFASRRVAVASHFGQSSRLQT